MSEVKQRIFEQFARIGSAVASAPRLTLLDLLAQGEASVETLADRSGLGLKNASAHLRRLYAAKLVRTRREGTRVYYGLADAHVFPFLRALQALGAARLPEVAELVTDYLESPWVLDEVPVSDLLARVRAGEVVLLNVRPEDEYRSGHAPGAVSVPIEDLETWIEDFEPGPEVVAYCRGAYCVFALEAVAALRDYGIEARCVSWGVPDLRTGGLPVDTGAGSP